MIVSGVQTHYLVVMKDVVIRVVGAVKHSKGWHDEPSWWLVIKDVLPWRGREYVIGTSNRRCGRHVERGPCSEGEVNWLHGLHCARR